MNKDGEPFETEHASPDRIMKQIAESFCSETTNQWGFHLCGIEFDVFLDICEALSDFVACRPSETDACDDLASFEFSVSTDFD